MSLMCPDVLRYLWPRVRCRHYAGPGFDAEREFARKWEGILEVLKELKDKSSGVGVAALQRSELAHRLWDSRCSPSLFGLLVQKYEYWQLRSWGAGCTCRIRRSSTCSAISQRRSTWISCAGALRKALLSTFSRRSGRCCSRPLRCCIYLLY